MEIASCRHILSVILRDNSGLIYLSGRTMIFSAVLLLSSASLLFIFCHAKYPFSVTATRMNSMEANIRTIIIANPSSFLLLFFTGYYPYFILFLRFYLENNGFRKPLVLLNTEIERRIYREYEFSLLPIGGKDESFIF